MFSCPTPTDLEPSTRLIVSAFGTDDQPESPSPALVLDLGEVTELTADGLGQLVSLHKRLRASGGQLVLCNVGERAYEVFEVTRLIDLLDVRRKSDTRKKPEIVGAGR